MKNILQRVLRILILLFTASAFVYYLWRHPETLQQLRHTSLRVIVLLVLLYVGWFGAMGLTLHGTLRICRTPLDFSENILLNAYSILVNFFVPGQGGVAVRGLYLKKRHKLGLRQYILATLVYYMCYAVVSAMMLLVSSRPWWQTCIGMALVVSGSMLVVYIYERRAETDTGSIGLSLPNLALLLTATVVQVTAQVAIYGSELRTVNPDITLSQIVTYTGAANFSVFVALTPGAIGIRESFLLLSEKLHHISTSTILAASLLDRSVFILFLGFLFTLTQIFHAKKSLGM